MMIYEAALIKPTSIDLWPHSYVEKPEDNPALAARIAKASEENAARQGRDNNRNIYRDPKFRRQDDLLYVRKEMAIGLLATCKQICHEATPIFWCKNTFRFSSDSNWLGVRRFLQTIGPNAIRRLRTLEVFVPLVYTPWTVTPDQEIEAFRDAKNFPKLHMAKVGLGVKGDNELYENMEMVTFLLTEAMATLELHLVLPRGFALNQQGVTSGLEPVIYFPEELQLKRPFTKVTLIIEPGAYVCGMGVPESVADNGVDYVCMPGSFWKKRIDTSEEEAKVLAVKKWKRTSEELEMLDGLQELMKENESIGVPGNGGRANKSPGLKKVERVLKGFGEFDLSLHMAVCNY
jgi:hypothetical protein